MTTSARSAAIPSARTLAWGVGVGAVALGLGAAFAISAWLIHPLMLPALLLLAGLIVLTLSRPEIGIAIAFVIVPLSNLGLTGQPPWLFMTFWSAFLCGLALWRRGSEPTEGTRRLPPLSAALGFNLLVAVSAFVLAGAGEDGYPEVRSLVTGFALFLAIALLVRDPRQFTPILIGIACSILIAGLYAAYQRQVGETSNQGFFTPDGALVGRVDAGFGHPNALAGFLVILIPFALAGVMLTRWTRPVFALAVLVGTFGIYASFSRGALIALAVIPFLFLRGRRVFVLAPLLAILLVLTTPGVVRERFATLTQSGSEVATRIDFWTTALSIWQSHPIAGAGLGEFPSAYAAARVPGRGFLPGTISEPPPHAHNLFLQALATEGLLGFVAIGLVLALAAWLALRLRGRGDRRVAIVGYASLASLMAFFIHNLFDVTLLEGTGIYFWALLGLLAAGSVLADEPQSDGG